MNEVDALEVCNCGEAIDVEAFENEYDSRFGYCPLCLHRQIEALKADRLEFAKSEPIEVERFDIADLGDDDDDDDDETSYVRVLRRVATANACEQLDAFNSRASIRGDEIRLSSQPNSDRAIVAFLRHSATNYDELLENLPDTFDNDTEYSDSLALDDGCYEIIRERVHLALKQAYPEIADLIEWLE